MYLAFFGLAEKPFSITPDPRYLYLSARHADALAHLVYGISEAGGFVQLTGEVGTGKTTIIRSLLSRTPQGAEIALILNPRLGPQEFLLALCEELGIGVPDRADSSSKEIVDVLNRYLLRAHANGHRVVLIVDEAQNLDVDVLEQIRLLTNLETETQKLLQIILIGQPELRTLLAREDLRQLAQRVTGRYHLDPLTRAETTAYVRHRLRVAGATADIFTQGALREIHHISRGIPRVINIICDRALLGAYTQDLHQIPASLVRRASAEVFDQEVAPSWMPLLVGSMAVLVLAGSGLLLWHYLPSRHAAIGTVSSTASAAVKMSPLPGIPTAGVAATTAGATTANGAAATSGTPAQNSTAPTAGMAGAADSNGGAAGKGTQLSALLTQNDAQASPDAAFRTLFSLWKANYTPGKLDGCTQAIAQGFRCLVQRGSLAQLRQLNRPAILMLTDDAGAAHQAVLRQLNDADAELLFGDRSYTISVSDLSRYWYGDFVLLWHPSSRDVRDLSAGMHGALVRQLRAQLDHWDGNAAAAPSDDYDDNLVQLVERFQRAVRLQVDGIAGIETQVALDAALATPDSPLLQSHALQQASTRGS
ncbi:MAG TPA: AAA family ATPase [Steroidobacteraceae bacterium]|jgi:general secretion pathway protein A|nr:AAA family ATPase [Steroidobacteraceae bacterium]